MEHLTGGIPGGIIAVRFDRGDLLLEGLEEIIQKQHIDTAIVTSGIGSLSRSRFHIITHTGTPPVDKFLDIETPMEVASIQGIIANGEPHLHASLYDCATQTMYAGHLEHGCRVCYLIELSIMRVDGIKLGRVREQASGIVQLTALK